MTPRQFESLDLLRAIASVAVLMWHMEPMHHGVFYTGYVSVDLFFLISGFIVAHAYERRLLTKELSLPTFFKVRAIRLYPLYAVGSLLGLSAIAFAIWASGGGRSQFKGPLVSLLAAVFVLPVPRDVHVASFVLNLPAWSLFFEIIANILYAIFILKASNRALCVVAAASALGLVAVAAGYGSADFGATGWQMLLGLPRVGYTYAVGVLVYRWWRARPRNLPSVPWPVPPLLFLALIACPVPAALRPVYDVAAILLVIPVIVVGALCTRLSGSAQAVARVGADLSYPLYMIHVPMIMFAEAAIRERGADPAIAFTLAGVGALLLSRLLDRRVDRPVRRWLTARWLDGRTPVRSAPAL